MTKKVIQGEDIVVLVGGKAMLHAESHSMKITPEFKDFRTIHTNGVEKSPGDVDWAIDGNGMVVIDPLIAANSSTSIIDTILAKKEIEVIVKVPIGDSTVKSWKAKAYFGSFSLEGKVGENTTYSFSIVRNGNLEPYNDIEE